MMKVKTTIKMLDEHGKAFFGNGPYRLLLNIEQTKSISKAAKEMNMAYSKAFNMVKTAESALGFDLVVSEIGGKDGGGSRLTAKAKALLDGFSKVNREIEVKTKTLYDCHIAPVIEKD
jgi:molybdate transport system regulatory protein